MRRTAICLSLLMIAATAAHAAPLSPGAAADHIGETATVCGNVASAHYAGRSRGKPTFLDIGHAYPNQDLAVVIWGNNRAAFGTPETLAGHRVCVTGSIKRYHGRPEIVLENPADLTE